MTMIIVIAASYAFAAVGWFFGVLKSELPRRSAYVFSALWPVTMTAVFLHQLNAWVEAAFTWAVERLD